MKRVWQITTIATVSIVSAALAIAQPGRNYRNRMYDPGTVETVSGTIEKVYDESGRGRGYGVHLDLKTETGIVPVHVGPAWYVEKQAMKLGHGDRLEVRGSRINYDGTSVIIAAEIRKDSEVLTLRHKDGTPQWAGPGPKPGQGPRRGAGYRWRHGQTD